MKFISDPLLYAIIFVAAIALLLFVLWLLGRIRTNQYYDAIIKYMRQPERDPEALTTWSGISDPDANGVMTSAADYPLEGVSDEIKLTVYGKDKPTLEEFIQNVKFSFSPIFTPPPSDPFEQVRRLTRSQTEPTSKAAQASPNPADLKTYDWLLVFDMTQTDDGYARQTGKEGEPQPYFAVGFNIDPTIKRTHAMGRCPSSGCSCNKTNNYNSNKKDIQVTVTVSVGAVDATLGSKYTISAGESKKLTLSNSSGSLQTLSVGGRNVGDNTYKLAGTWNVS